jgi:hypothetical protein
VCAQRLAQGEAHQPRAIALLLVPRRTLFVELHLGDACEPAPEILAVVVGTQLGAIRNAVVIRIRIGGGRGRFRALRALRRRRLGRRGVRLRRAAAGCLQQQGSAAE